MKAVLFQSAVAERAQDVAQKLLPPARIVGWVIVGRAVGRLHDGDLGRRSPLKSATKSLSVPRSAFLCLGDLVIQGEHRDLARQLVGVFQLIPPLTPRFFSHPAQIGGGLCRITVFQVVVTTSPEEPAMAKTRLGWVEPRNELCEWSNTVNWSARAYRTGRVFPV